MGFRHHVALGDPQAPFATVLEVLDRARLLGDHGMLRDDVRLVSIGDHFDWGRREDRERATADGVALLSWFAAHPPEQLTLLLGNHDLARVGELAHFADDEAFFAARTQADAIYRQGQIDEVAQRPFLEAFPFVPDVECVARDFSGFAVEQRRLVEELLRTRRFRLAAHHRGLLLVHAGMTLDDLAAIGAPSDSAEATAEALNGFLDTRVDAWTGGELDLRPLHQPGSAKTGWGRGALFHRPADPALAQPDDLEGPPRRRFDPRRLPPGFTQVIGHIRDKKCRELMPAWSEPTAAGDGPLRSLTIDGEQVRYVAGVRADARLIFVDGGLLHTSTERYQLLDLDARAPHQSTRVTRGE
jgi:hypothetical protein